MLGREVYLLKLLTYNTHTHTSQADYTQQQSERLQKAHKLLRDSESLLELRTVRSLYYLN